MKNLSISQEYVLCTLTSKGSFPALNTNAQVCMIAGALLDLVMSGSLAVDEKHKVNVIAGLPEERSYLSSLYNDLKESKAKTLTKITEDYYMSFGGKKYEKLLGEIGRSLVEEGCASLEYGGILGKTKYFIPDAGTVDQIIQKIRAELLEDGAMTDETTALASLLEKSDQIKRYFSKYEAGQLKTRIQEIRKSKAGGLVKEMIDDIEAFIACIIAVIA